MIEIPVPIDKEKSLETSTLTMGDVAASERINQNQLPTTSLLDILSKSSSQTENLQREKLMVMKSQQERLQATQRNSGQGPTGRKSTNPHKLSPTSTAAIQEKVLVAKGLTLPPTKNGVNKDACKNFSFESIANEVNEQEICGSASPTLNECDNNVNNKLSSVSKNVNSINSDSTKECNKTEDKSSKNYNNSLTLSLDLDSNEESNGDDMKVVIDHIIEDLSGDETKDKNEDSSSTKSDTKSTKDTILEEETEGCETSVGQSDEILMDGAATNHEGCDTEMTAEEEDELLAEVDHVVPPEDAVDDDDIGWSVVDEFHTSESESDGGTSKERKSQSSKGQTESSSLEISESNKKPQESTEPETRDISESSPEICEVSSPEPIQSPAQAESEPSCGRELDNQIEDGPTTDTSDLNADEQETENSEVNEVQQVDLEKQQPEQSVVNSAEDTQIENIQTESKPLGVVTSVRDKESATSKAQNNLNVSENKESENVQKDGLSADKEISISDGQMDDSSITQSVEESEKTGSISDAQKSSDTLYDSEISIITIDEDEDDKSESIEDRTTAKENNESITESKNNNKSTEDIQEVSSNTKSVEKAIALSEGETIETKQIEDLPSIVKNVKEDMPGVEVVAEKEDPPLVDINEKEETSVVETTEKEDSPLIEIKEEEDTPLVDYKKKEDSLLVEITEKEDKDEDTPVVEIKEREDNSVGEIKEKEDISVGEIKEKEDISVGEIKDKEDLPLVEIKEKDDTPLVEIKEKDDTPLVEIKEKEDIPLVEIKEKEDLPLVEIKEKDDTPLSGIEKEDAVVGKIKENETSLDATKEKEDLPLTDFEKKEDLLLGEIKEKENTELAGIKENDDMPSVEAKQKVDAPLVEIENNSANKEATDEKMEVIEVEPKSENLEIKSEVESAGKKRQLDEGNLASDEEQPRKVRAVDAEVKEDNKVETGTDNASSLKTEHCSLVVQKVELVLDETSGELKPKSEVQSHKRKPEEELTEANKKFKVEGKDAVVKDEPMKTQMPKIKPVTEDVKQKPAMKVYTAQEVQALIKAHFAELMSNTRNGMVEQLKTKCAHLEGLVTKMAERMKELESKNHEREQVEKRKRAPIRPPIRHVGLQVPAIIPNGLTGPARNAVQLNSGVKVMRPLSGAGSSYSGAPGVRLVAPGTQQGPRYL